jgi:predicted ATPase
MPNRQYEQILNTQYPEAIENAVRYGYQYRLEAEKNANKRGVYYCLAEASAILKWLAELVVAGIAYDCIKTQAKQFWSYLMRMKIKIPEDVNKVLIDEDELRRFVQYVDEFHDNKISATEKEISYIREEIVADYTGKRAGEIYKEHRRMPSTEELISITREAKEYADGLLNSKR